MRGFRLFERPTHAFSTVPALQILGYLPDHTPGDAYEGRLSFINAIGRAHVEIVEEDSRLPPGSYAYVDNLNQQIVLKWPAYSLPDSMQETVINGDFQEGMEGWTDLRGNSWEVRKYEDDDTNVGPGDRPRPAGNLAAWMTGVGRGDHILESIRYPVNAGQSISAHSLWDQGPSNKDNNNLWTALGLYRDGQFIAEVRGDRIHDRTNRTRHWSTVNHVIQPGINEVTVRLIAHRRNGRNREIIVDNVETTGLSYAVGTDVEDYYVKLKLTDSAHRVAYWEGPLFYASAWFTSAPYPIIVIESIQTSGQLTEARELLSPQSMDELGTWGMLTGIELLDTTRYVTHAQPNEDRIATSGQLTAIQLVETTRYVTHPQPNEDRIQTSGQLTAITLTVTTAYVSHDVGRDAVTTSGQLIGITLT